jgi:hypothetical protein
LGNLAAQFHRFDPKTGSLDGGAVVRDRRLETVGAEKLELGPFRQQRVDFAVYDAIARAKASTIKKLHSSFRSQALGRPSTQPIVSCREYWW